MQHARLTDIIAPGFSNVLSGLIVTLLIWYDIFLPSAEVLPASNEVFAGQSPLALLIEGLFSSSVRFGKIVALALFLLSAFILLRLNEVFSFIKVRTVLPSFFFLIIGSLLLPHEFSVEIIVILLILLALYSSFKLLIEEKPVYAFNTSLLILTASLLSFSCVWLLILFWIFSFITNTFSVKIWLASLLGALIPVIYAFIGFGFEGQADVLLNYFRESLSVFAFRFDFSVSEMLYLTLVGLLTVISLIHFMRDYTMENIKPRQEFSYIIVIFLVLLILLLFSVPDSPLIFALLLFFAGIVSARIFSLENNRFTKILLAFFLAGSALFFFYNIG
jgi:hypothetical protein